MSPSVNQTGPADLIRLFNDALNRGDVAGMMAMMTEDCIYDNTYPAPDGTRYRGQADVRAFWEDFFRGAREPRIEIEDLFAAGDRCAMSWTYHWKDADGRAHHVRGADLYRLRDGKVAEKLSYVKG